MKTALMSLGNNTTIGHERLEPTPITMERKCEWDTTNISLIFCYFLILFIGTCGNILVLAMFNRKSKQSALNLLIMYLAAFDLFASIFVPFIFGYWVWVCDLQWHFGLFGCKTLPVATRIFTSVSIGILLIMAIERCRVIISPFKPPLSRKTIHFAVFVTVILAVVSETHYITTLHINGDGECAVVVHEYYIIASITITLLRTVTFMSIFLSTTLLVTCKLRRKSGIDNTETKELASHMEVRARRKRKAMKMLAVMMVVFGITVLPRDLFQMSLVISYLLPEKYWIDYSLAILRINTILKILQTSNSIYNVFIYAGMYKGFVANALKICKRVKKIKKQYTIRRRTIQRSYYEREEEYHLSLSKSSNLTRFSPDCVSTDDVWI